MQTTGLDPHEDGQAAKLFELYRAVHEADTPDKPEPLWEPFLMMMRQEHPEVRVEYVSAHHDGRLVGAGLVALPTVDNRHLAQADVWVHPGHRRRGAGRAVMEQLTRRAREDGRTVLLSRATGPAPDGPQRSDAGARFLEVMGFSAALALMGRRVDLSAVDISTEQALLETCLPRAVGYDLDTWIGLTPEHVAPGVAYLANRVVADAPRGEMDLEDTSVDAARLHAEERNALARGIHLVGVAAVHRGTGQVAAMTSIDVRPPGDHGDIWLTIADPAHRGHRLGTIVKIEAHRRVRQLFPKLRFVLTGNADSNAHMVAVNDALGYVAYETLTNYQRRLD